MSGVHGFVRARGRCVVNGDGTPFLLRGVGLGSWLLPEGYMWRMPAEADRPRRIEALVADLLGEPEAGLFWERYWDRYITEADIERIAAEGFNSLRLPMSARYLTGADDEVALIPSRIARIDRLLDWCRNHGLYVILDLHGAPGGQTGTNIDDSANDSPELFTDQANQDRTVAIWRALAERYRDEWIVAGYDLLNEPLPDWFAEYNDRVVPLYRRISAAIREVDERHMIILEGVHWATDWSIFSEIWDDNVMLQFHKYWNNPDIESLAPYLQARDHFEVPIFMGEGGENNTDWYAGAFRLFDELEISWNFWTWKKLATGNSPASIRMPAGWETIAAYAAGGPRPEAAVARAALAAYLDGLPLAACDYHQQVVNALLRRPPVRVPAIFYSAVGVRQRVAVGEATRVDFRAGDGSRIGYVTGRPPSSPRPNFAHTGGEAWSADEWLYLELAPDDWAAYDFVVPDGAGRLLRLELSLSWISLLGGEACVVVGIDEPAVEQRVYPARMAEGAGEWSACRAEVAASPGLRRVRVRAEGATVRLVSVCGTIA